jgi:hypothetical protein
MFDYIVFSVLTFSFFYLIFSNAKLLNKNKELQILLAQSEIDKNIIKNQFEINSNNDFVGFLSKSRDDAFSYIDLAQKDISEFIENVDSHIQYFDEYGIVFDSHPLHKSMKAISENYSKIKNLVPKEAENS